MKRRDGSITIYPEVTSILYARVLLGDPALNVLAKESNPFVCLGAKSAYRSGVKEATKDGRSLQKSFLLIYFFTVTQSG